MSNMKVTALVCDGCGEIEFRHKERFSKVTIASGEMPDLTGTYDLCEHCIPKIGGMVGMGNPEHRPATKGEVTRKEWAPDEEDFLIANIGKPRVELAEYLGRSISSVSQRLVILRKQGKLPETADA